MFRRMWIEGMYSIYLIKKIERSETSLRNSIRLPFDKLRPRARRGESFDPELTTEGLVAGCGSLLNRGPAIEAEVFIKMETSTCRVSYKGSRLKNQQPASIKEALSSFDSTQQLQGSLPIKLPVFEIGIIDKHLP